MKTIKAFKLAGILCIFILSTNLHGQKIGKIIKKKAGEVVEEVLNEKENKTVTSKQKKPKSNFIDGNIIFSDNFNNERISEFPSKWTHINGTVQNNQALTLGKKEGVVEFLKSSKIKPTFKNDDYLGNSFKIEGQFYFHGKGNEAYTLNLMNNNDVYKAYKITIRGDGIVPAGTSSEYSRMPYKLPYPGWRTVQLSFNKGVLKVFYEGTQLINNPDLNKGDDKHIAEFTHLEVSALSRAGNYQAMINNITIAQGGLPLYKRLVNEGRLIVHDIHFDVDSYFIKESSYSTLNKIAEMLNSNTDINVIIEGHTDANGTNQFNQKLSENRAKAVKNYLSIKGINSKRLSTIGYGEERPIASGNNEKAWAKNRRVEFVLKK